MHHPFFLWVDFFDPHEPWDPPEYMVRRYDPDYTGTPMLHPNYGKASDLTPEELRNLEKDAYEETNVFGDNPGIAKDLHGKLLAWLKEINAPKEAIEVFG